MMLPNSVRSLPSRGMNIEIMNYFLPFLLVGIMLGLAKLLEPSGVFIGRMKSGFMFSSQSIMRQVSQQSKHPAASTKL